MCHKRNLSHAHFEGKQWPVLLSFRGCKNFLKRWKRRAYIKVVFRIFLTWTFPGGHLAVRQWNFFQVSRGAKPSANLKKISLSNRQMSKGKSECQKNPENHLYVGKSFSKASRNFLHPSKERRYSFPFRQSLQNMAAYKVLLVTKMSGRMANVRLNRAGPATFRKVSLQGFSTMERDLQVRHYWVIPVQPFQFTLVLKPCNWLVS